MKRAAAGGGAAGDDASGPGVLGLFLLVQNRFDMEIRAMRPDDWPAVKAIYEQGIATKLATFETSAPDWADWDETYLRGHRLVAEKRGAVVGWAALLPVSRRSCYAGVVEDSIYVADSARGRGIGRALMERLLDGADRAGFWTVQASVFAENAASVSFHERCGFRIVGTRERIGRLDGVWRDTVLLERRSS
ncbi:MAG TPA: GNAT family N-acetyltransferase [Candidatus Limnocylindrales bacterium]|nr:GNAT family N-acetyltransferase [Candidatus Limnocylindrales bacterium]